MLLRLFLIFPSNLFLLFSDGNVRYYEWESDSLHALAEHKSSDPQRGMCFLPRRALSVSDCEIARAYKVSGTTIEPIAFVVPRRVNISTHLPDILFILLSLSRPKVSNPTSSLPPHQPSPLSAPVNSFQAKPLRPSSSISTLEPSLPVLLPLLFPPGQAASLPRLLQLLQFLLQSRLPACLPLLPPQLHLPLPPQFKLHHLFHPLLHLRHRVNPPTAPQKTMPNSSVFRRRTRNCRRSCVRHVRRLGSWSCRLKV